MSKRPIQPRPLTPAADSKELKRGPGRPAGQTETKERIVEVAVETFAERGYASTSMRKIAGAADVTPPAVSHHFRSKEALYARVLEEVALSLELWLFGGEEQGGVERVLGVVESYVSWLDAHPDYARIICFEFVHDPDRMVSEVSFLAPVVKQAVELIDAEQNAGRVAPVDAELLVVDVLSAALHYQHQVPALRLFESADTRDAWRSRVKQGILNRCRRILAP